MKILKQILIIVVLSQMCFSQNLKVADLTLLCSKKNWENVNQFLVSKGWSFYESKKGDSNEFNTITWSYKKDKDSEKAQGWIHLYTVENTPDKIDYSFFNESSYLVFKNSITPSGFKLVNNSIEDNEIVSSYSSPSFNLIVTTKKITEDDFLSSSKTGYSISISKKQSLVVEKKTSSKFLYTIKNKNTLDWLNSDKEILQANILYVKIDGKTYKYGDKINLVPGRHLIEETILFKEDRSVNSKDQLSIFIYEDGSVLTNDQIAVDKNLNITVNFNFGACPYFYYQTADKVVYGGELIRNQNSIEKDKLDVLKIDESYISEKQLKIIITEEKEEETFLDAIYLLINDEVICKVNSEDNNTNEKLLNVDNNYLILKKNDRVNVFFNIPENIKVRSLKLYSKGYYLTLLK